MAYRAATVTAINPANDQGLCNRAYVTFLAGNGDDVEGVLGLARGLKKTKSKYSLVVAVLPDVPKEHRETLEAEGCTVKEVESVYPLRNHIQLTIVPFVTNYSKLCIWKFEEYGKMIYLNNDTQVYHNIDGLFDLPDGKFYAPLDCLCEESGSHTSQCQQCPVVSTWQQDKLGSPPPIYFNTGMFVFEPSATVFDHLLKDVESISPDAFAEQHVLNKYFGKTFEILPKKYFSGLTSLQQFKESVNPDEVMVIQYCTPAMRPWRYTPESEKMNLDTELVENMKEKWLSIYNDGPAGSNKQKSLKGKTITVKRSITTAMRKISFCGAKKKMITEENIQEEVEKTITETD